MLIWNLHLIMSIFIIFETVLLPADAAPLLQVNSIARVNRQGHSITQGPGEDLRELIIATSPSSMMLTSEKVPDASENDTGKVQAIALKTPISQPSTSLKTRFISYPFDGLVESIALVSITVLIALSATRFCEKRREDNDDDESPGESHQPDQQEADSYRLEHFTP